MKIKKQTLACLVEAGRRAVLKSDSSIDGSFVGLGYPSEYKQAIEDGYMKPSFGENERVLNWYCLTEKGKKIVKKFNLKTKDFDEFDLNLDGTAKVEKALTEI